MARGNPQQIAARWSQRLSGATQQITEGIDRVTESPGRKAAAQRGAWLNNTTAAADKWATRVGSVSTEDWKAAAKAGVGRVAAGAQAKQQKMERFLDEFLPHLEAGQRQLAAMPRGNFDQNMARAIQMARHNAGFRRRSSG